MAYTNTYTNPAPLGVTTQIAVPFFKATGWKDKVKKSDNNLSRKDPSGAGLVYRLLRARSGRPHGTPIQYQGCTAVK